MKYLYIVLLVLLLCGVSKAQVNPSGPPGIACNNKVELVKAIEKWQSNVLAAMRKDPNTYNYLIQQNFSRQTNLLIVFIQTGKIVEGQGDSCGPRFSK